MIQGQHAKKFVEIQRRFADLDEQFAKLDRRFGGFGDLNFQDHSSQLICSVVEAGLALEDHVLRQFYSSRNVQVNERANHFDDLSDQEKMTIADWDMYREAMCALGDDFRVIVDYRNSLAHPCKLLVEIEIMEKCESVIDDIDTKMFEKAVALKNRLKQVPNIESIIENYRKRKLEEMDE